jgi:hypothetical protein
VPPLPLLLLLLPTDQKAMYLPLTQQFFYLGKT